MKDLKDMNFNEVCEKLLEQRKDFKKPMMSVFQACKNGDLDMVKYLVSQGIPITNEHLQISCTCDNLELIQYLLDNGADITDDNYYAVRLADKNGQGEVIEFLMKYCESKNIEFKWG